MSAPPEQPYGVVIRSREVWDKLCAVEQAVNDIKGSLRLLVDRSDRTDADVRQLRVDMESELQKIRDEEVKPLRAEVEELKDRRFPLPVVGTLLAFCALLATLIGLVLTS